MGQRPTTKIVYGFSLEELPNYKGLDEYDMNRLWENKILEEKGIKKPENENYRSPEWEEYRSQRERALYRIPEIINWGCDGGEDEYFLGVVLVRADWEQAEVLDLHSIEGAGDGGCYEKIFEFCDFFDIPMQGPGWVILTELS